MRESAAPYPELSLGEEFDGNIRAADNDQDREFITAVTPGVRLRADWHNRALNSDGPLTAGLESRREMATAAPRQLRSSGAKLASESLSMVDPRKHARYGYGDSGYYYGPARKSDTG